MVGLAFKDIDNLVAQSANPEAVQDDWLDAYVAQFMGHVSVRLNYYRFLYLLVERAKPDVAMEIGVEYGCASAHMALAAYQYRGHVVGIDPNIHHAPAVNIPTRVGGVYRFIQGRSTDPRAFAEVVREVERYGMIGVVFQDSSHHYAESVDEWNAYKDLLVPGAIWVCDDITPAFFEPGVDEKSMVAYWQELPGQKRLYPDVLHQGNTMGVMIYD